MKDTLTGRGKLILNWIPNDVDRVLEIGCAYGDYTSCYARKCRKIVAIDPNKDLIKKTQWQCFSRTSNWMNAKKDINTPSENQSCEAFLKICELVDWEEVPPAFFEELNNIVKETGNVYMMMEGNLPLSKILENLRES